MAAKGVSEIVADGAKAQDVDRLSVIHIHVNALTADEARGLKERLAKVLTQVRAAVGDWKPMLARLDRAISEFRYQPIPLAKNAVTEAIAFLEWLRDDNFTFLGMREFRYSGGEKSGTLTRAANPGLGILADPNVRVLRRAEGEATTPEIRAFLYGPDPLIVTKANAKSIVHRRAYLDYVGIKTFDKKGALTGELRVVGLFTSTAYTRSVMKIPYLRSKAETVIHKSGFDPNDHSGKALINVLESYPRDELFQIAVPTLRKHAEAILGLVERPRVRALYRVDQFDRFVSVIVFVPRDRYDSVVREKIGDVSQDSLRRPAFRLLPGFPGRRPRARPFHHRPLGRQDAEGRAGRDRRSDPRHHPHLGGRAARGRGELGRRHVAARHRRRGFLKAIAARSPPPKRLLDARRIAGISPQKPIAIDYYRHADQPPERAALKIYHHGRPVSLSRRVPVLENIGFKVISERTFEVAGGPDGPVFIHDMELENAFDKPIDLVRRRQAVRGSLSVRLAARGRQ